MLDTVPHMLRIDGPKVREARLRRLLTIEELSRLARLNQSHLGMIERSRGRKVQIRTVRKLAKALEVDPDEILSPASPDGIGETA